MPRKHLYERIKSRTDGRRPMTIKEAIERLQKIDATPGAEKEGECFVTQLKILTPRSSTMIFSWSEKDANRQREEHAEATGAYL
jgi:hypothetical protein